MSICHQMKCPTLLNSLSLFLSAVAPTLWSPVLPIALLMHCFLRVPHPDQDLRECLSCWVPICRFDLTEGVHLQSHFRNKKMENVKIADLQQLLQDHLWSCPKGDTNLAQEQWPPVQGDPAGKQQVDSSPGFPCEVLMLKEFMFLSLGKRQTIVSTSGGGQHWHLKVRGAPTIHASYRQRAQHRLQKYWERLEPFRWPWRKAFKSPQVCLEGHLGDTHPSCLCFLSTSK